MQIFNNKGHLPVLGQRPCLRPSSRLSPRSLPRIGAISRLLSNRRFNGSYAKGDDFEESGLPPPPDVIVELKVDKGDTLEGLAEMYHLPFEKLLAANKGKDKVKAGDRLHFKIPLPKDEEALRALLTPSKELIREAVLERAAETGQRTIGGSTNREQNEDKRFFQGVGPEGGEHTYLATAKYLGGAAGRVLLVGLALYALVRMGKKLTGRDKADAARSGAAWPAMDDADLTTRFRLKRPEGDTPDAPVQGNRGGEASTSTAPLAGGILDSPAAPVAAQQSSSSQKGATPGHKAATQKGGESGWSSKDPAWLALPAVHYAMLPGNQQPCFRVALGHGDTRAWLAWEDPDNLRRLLRCMEENGLVPEPSAVRIVACPPYEYLQTAEHNGRPVGFVPKGTLIEEAWHDEQLMDALVAAAQVVPRQPGGDPSSAHSILSRWRLRTGVAIDRDEVLGSGAWEVRTIDEDEEADYKDSLAGGRVIEAFTEPLDADSSNQQPLQSVQHTDNGASPGENAAEQDAGMGDEKDDRTVWQRLRGVKQGGGGAKSGNGRAGQNGADRGGRLSARRILERSTSKNGGSGGTDPFAEMLGLGSSSRNKPEQRERPGPEQQQQQHQAPSSRGHKNGALKGASGQAPGSADVSGSASGSADVDERARRYAEILGKQSDVAGSHTHLDKVRRDTLPVEINDDEEGDRTAEAPSDSPAALPGPAADWAQAARRGQRLTDLTADAAASQQRSRPEKHSAGGRSSTGPAAEWLRLPMVCVPVREFRGGGYGFLTADTATAVATEGGGNAHAAPAAIVGFADRNDAQQVQWLWDSWPQGDEGANRVLPLQPAKLQSLAQEQGFEVVVFPKGLLPLRPGMSEQELGAVFSAYASS